MSDGVDAESRATELYLLGRAAFDAGDLPRCVEHMRASAWLEPHYKTMETLGEALLRLGDLTESVVWLSAAAGIAPRQARARLLLAQALESRGEIDAARVQLEEALRINPRFASARAMLERLPGIDEGER